MYSGPDPRRASQPLTASAMNSGPLSDRMCSGTPRTSNTYSNVDTTSSAVMPRSTSIVRHSRVYSSTIGRIFNGTVRLNDPVAVVKLDGSVQETRVTKLFAFDGLKRVEIERAAAGDIVCLAGIEDITIGETIASPEHRVAIPPIAVDEPTVSMIFGVNTAPTAGKDGQYVTSRNLRDRLGRELLGNVSTSALMRSRQSVGDNSPAVRYSTAGRSKLPANTVSCVQRRCSSAVHSW